MKRLLVFALVAALNVANPPAHASVVGQLANIEVFDRAEQRGLPVYWHEGKAYVVGKPGNEYQITIRNRAGADVLAVVSVDGINVVSGENAEAVQSGYVIDNWRRLDVAGWRKSLSQTAAFYFTSLGNSYAARTGRPNNVGVIGVALFRRKPLPPPIAISKLEMNSFSEPSASRADGAASAKESTQDRRAAPAAQAPLGTGHGRRETSNVSMVDFERATPNPEELVTIYYDSYANLVARGVIRVAGMRDPQPFPGRFVADPPH